MGAHLITGYAGKAHITSGDTGMFNAAIIGGGKYVLPIGSMFEASIVTNNLVKVMDGCLINQGRNINIPVNDYEECIIDNGLQGLKRNDLIVIRYSKDVETEIEKAETIVIKGVSGDTAVDPSYLTGDILSGAATDDFPLYRVKLDGLNITALEPMFNVMVSMNSLKESLAKCETDLSTLNTNLGIKYGGTITNMIGTFNYLTLIKTGNVKVLNCSITISGTITTWSDNILGRINEPEFRPLHGFLKQLIAYNTGKGTFVPIQLNVTTEGNIILYCADKTNLDGFSVSLVYV